MPYLSCSDAGERIAKAIETAKAGVLREIAVDLLSMAAGDAAGVSRNLATVVRQGVEPELLVELWNVLFPEDHDVWFNEETNEIHYESGLVQSAD
jgi:hypothetical protein